MARHPASRRRRLLAGERGVLSVEMVLLIPTVMALLFLGVQAATYYHARTLALAGAQEGARVAAGEQSSAPAGAAAAQAWLAHTAGTALTGVAATATRTEQTATVTVTGRAPSLIPGWQAQVRQSATLPTERLTG